MGEIKILSKQVASQIAAGEVVERPASIVRELLDNSIDANATRIDIKIESGGKHLIRVRDNGKGMSPEDLVLSIERHATSKILELSDLFSIKTLGFRGEALASIAAVSKMQIVSRPLNQLAGFRLRVSGGKLLGVEEIGTPVGTLVEVEDLFFNLPVRKKFLRSDRAEAHAVMDAIIRQVLPFKQIAFKVDEGTKNILDLADSLNPANRFLTIFGKDFSRTMIVADYPLDHINMHAFLGPPELARSKGDKLWIYVNKRHIRDKLLFKAVMDGYGKRLMHGQYPQAVLFIEMTPDLVDFNVHPSKQEIRFQQTQFVYQAVMNSVKKILDQNLKTPFQDLSKLDSEATLHVLNPQSSIAEPLPLYRYRPRKDDVFSERKVFSERPEPEMECNRRPRIIGQLNATYILCQARDGLVLIDQHAAHERIVYEKLKRFLQESKLEKQFFLIPPKFEFSLKESRILQEKSGKLLDLGIELEFFGGTSFILRSIPGMLVNARYMDFIHELIPLLEEDSDLTSAKVLERFLSVMACHAAIRAGQALSFEEMQALLESLENPDLLPHCPHGRPIMRQIPFNEIEKMFKRLL